ncbi:hypothetical protein DY245_19660 [Streptomyces inhibens]|uniref:Uncharacterized protein n=1 Tax=Streptomyces inhibens TaxID=2293571 RepID=A0A371Q314_STRIH|nr:hypothetical protein [Streptomyces inhibens]REK88723.1 hypothetical protein DY245_19660 [Streptomyces inhibens]
MTAPNTQQWTDLAAATTSSTHQCPACKDLERGRKQAEAARDLSRVTDFRVLIVRHRMRHAAAES